MVGEFPFLGWVRVQKMLICSPWGGLNGNQNKNRHEGGGASLKKKALPPFAKQAD